MNESKLFYVYVYFDMFAIPRYVGKGKGTRWLRHLWKSQRHKNRRFQKLIETHGKKLPRLKLWENLTEVEAFEIEVALIAAIGRGKHGPLYNLTDGGEGVSGSVCPQERRERIAASLRGKKHTLKRRANQSAAHKGKKQPPELVAKRVAARAGYRHPEETRRKIGDGNRGKAHGPISEETRAKLSAASTGRRHKPESREKVRQSKLGKKRPPFSAEHRAKTSATMKAFFAAKRAAQLQPEL